MRTERIDARESHQRPWNGAVGETRVEGPLAGLFARAVVVVDPSGTVVHSQLVPEIAQEPDYAAALATVR